ncbi:MAG: hypothetical protein J6T72_05120 [Alphaproteobacteria bacterium]|nr:hypothetical protein [Alphaproteobacteria bacterium]
MNSSLRVGMDFHGVITENPTFFRDFSALLFEKGHSVYIVSGGPYSVEKNFLDIWGVKYTEIFSLLDHFARRGQVEYFANGNFKVPDCLWNEEKGIYCRNNDISVHIDDTLQYSKNFTTPFCWYNQKDGIGTIGEEKINFNLSPGEVLLSIEGVLTYKNG